MLMIIALYSILCQFSQKLATRALSENDNS